MKKKFFAAILMAMALAAFSLAAFSLAACDYSSVTPITPVADIPDAATVEVGDSFDFETAAIAQGEKVYSPKTVTITFGENETVEFAGTSFVPSKVGEYTVTYTFDIDGEIKTYTTVVTACDTTKPSIILSDDIPIRVEYDSDVELPEFTAVDICDGTLDTDVKVYRNDAGKTPIDITDGQFKVDTYDGVVIEVSAIDTAGNTSADSYEIAVRGEREVDYFENEPYAAANAVPFGGGKTEYNVNPEYAIQGTGSMRFYTDINGKWVYCGLPSIGEAVRIAGGKAQFKAEYNAVTVLLFNASPYDCEIGFHYWKKNPANGLPQDDTLIQNYRLVANCWTKISVPADKIADAYADDIFFGFNFNGSNHETNNAYANFCTYIDCIRLSKPTDIAGININLSDVKQKANGDTTDVELIKLSALGEIDFNKLFVTALDKDGNLAKVQKTDTAYVLKNVAAGQYTVQYMYANGENIDVFSQSVELYIPLADPNFESFEGGGMSHALAPISGRASVGISTEKAHSGTHALKVTTGVYKWTNIPFMLDNDMLEKIKNGGDDVELSMWVYIEGNGSMTYNLRFSGLKQGDNGGYVGGDWAMIYSDTFGNNVPTGQWLQIKYGKKFNSPAIEQIKQTGGIMMVVEIASDGVGDGGSGESVDYPFTYYVDDLEVTQLDSSVTINAEDKDVPFVSGTPIELASFEGENFSAENLIVTLNGQPYTDYTFAGNKLSFTPSGMGKYVFEYTHKNGYFVKTATQTIDVYNPAFDGFERSNHATVIISGDVTSEYSISGVEGNYYSGSTGLWCYVGSPYVSIRIMFNEDMLKAIDDTSTVLLRIKIKDKTANTGVNLRVHAYNGNSTSWDSGLGIGCDGNGQWWERGDTPVGEWLEIKFTDAEAVKQIKTNGGIVIYNDVDRFGGHPVQVCVDDIQVKNNANA